MTHSTPSFLDTFKGSFKGVLKWPQLEQFWQTLKLQNGDWYIYAIGDLPPSSPSNQDQLNRFIDEIDLLLRKEHTEDYCGIVYADDLNNPTFIKIFDPNNLGVSCGFSENPPLPGWIISRLKPVDLPDAFPPTGKRKRWWQKIFA